MRFLAAFLLFISFHHVYSQSDSLNISGYLEMYGAYDDPRSTKHERPSFLYNHSRVEEFAINLAWIKCSWQRKDVRANVAMMSGSYSARNLATENTIFRHVFEANAGFKISKKKNIWLDAGILPSHIGLESAIGSDNLTLTRSLIAENTPYYETGARISYFSSDSLWYIAGLVTNGWQRIYREDGLYPPSLGGQISYHPSKKWMINYSNYAGDISPENDVALRVFHNLYFTYRASAKWSFVGCFDYGMQPDLNSKDWPLQSWLGYMAVVRFAPTSNFSLNARYEGFVDQKNMIVRTPFNESFSITGYSLNTDFRLHTWALLRFEAKYYNSPYTFFEDLDGNGVRNYLAFTTSLSLHIL